MINCIECPFLTINYLDTPDCGLGFKQLISHKLPENIIKPVSKECKLDAVTYSLKDKKESISFVPEWFNDESIQETMTKAGVDIND